MGSRTRTEITSEEKRRDHQKSLAKQINEEARKRLMDGKDSVTHTNKVSNNIAYKHVGMLPCTEPSVKELKLFVDKK